MVCKITSYEGSSGSLVQAAREPCKPRCFASASEIGLLQALEYFLIGSQSVDYNRPKVPAHVSCLDPIIISATDF